VTLGSSIEQAQAASRSRVTPRGRVRVWASSGTTHDQKCSRRLATAGPLHEEESLESLRCLREPRRPCGSRCSSL